VALRVQKYGGTSVGTPERICRVAGRVAAERRAGHDVVVVVSAMGHTTDELLALAAQVSPNPRLDHPRELDMLLTAGERIAMALTAMAICDLGFEAISLTGSQAAIITDEAHTVARIEEVRATRVREELDAGRVVIVAGFQGVSRSREVTTLGRGGSDTTAVALAAALRADSCDIFTDVDGIFTADPRRVPEARLIPVIGYEEMIELASAGAQVMQPRAVEIGARFDVPIRVRSTFRDGSDPSTLITRSGGMEQMVVTGLASNPGYARLVLRGLPADTAAVSRVLSALAAEKISVDMASHADLPGGRRQLQLSIREDDLPRAEPVAQGLIAELGGEAAETVRGLSRVSLVGSGMTGVPGVYARALEALVGAGLEVHALSTSPITISMLVDAGAEDRTLQILHSAFDLAKGHT
jgi:aspartate kinase